MDRRSKVAFGLGVAILLLALISATDSPRSSVGFFIPAIALIFFAMVIGPKTRRLRDDLLRRKDDRDSQRH
jgi:hypothetical protein